MSNLYRNDYSYVNIEDNYYNVIGALKDNLEEFHKMFELQQKYIEKIQARIEELEKEKNKTFEQTFWED